VLRAHAVLDTLTEQRQTIAQKIGETLAELCREAIQVTQQEIVLQVVRFAAHPFSDSYHSRDENVKLNAEGQNLRLRRQVRTDRGDGQRRRTEQHDRGDHAYRDSEPQHMTREQKREAMEGDTWKKPFQEVRQHKSERRDTRDHGEEPRGSQERRCGTEELQDGAQLWEGVCKHAAEHLERKMKEDELDESKRAHVEEVCEALKGLGMPAPPDGDDGSHQEQSSDDEGMDRRSSVGDESGSQGSGNEVDNYLEEAPTSDRRRPNWSGGVYRPPGRRSATPGGTGTPSH
jgi:hypothetical protein